MSAALGGSCLCEAVVYELHGPPLKTALCHCLNCQKASGSAFMANSFYLKSQVKVKQGPDALKAYQDSNLESGHTISRVFCSHCGSPLFVTNVKYPDVIIVSAGTITGNLQGWAPAREYYCKRRLAWMPDLGGTLKFMTDFNAKPQTDAP